MGMDALPAYMSTFQCAVTMEVRRGYPLEMVVVSHHVGTGT